MAKKAFICRYCGKEFMSTAHEALYCCPSHRKKYRWEVRQKVVACKHNCGVNCTADASCDRCGWNPVVAKKRMEALG